MDNSDKLRFQFKTIVLNKRQECDFELIVNKGFSPLNGFMKEGDYNSVVDNMRLIDGKLWAMPITLAIDQKTQELIKGEEYVLLESETGLLLGLMDISKPGSIYKPDISREAEKVYGADDTNHPYVKILYGYQNEGKVFNVGGDIVNYIMPPDMTL